MQWQWTPFALPSLFAAALTLAAVPYVWRRRPAPGASWFVVLCLTASWWSLTQTIGVSLADLPSKVLLAKLQYVGVMGAPLAWFAFALDYSRRDRWLKGTRAWALALFPAITLALAFTNERHGLVWRELRVIDSGPFAALVIRHGPWFGATVAYTYAQVAAATALTTWTLAQSPHYHHLIVGVLAAPLLVLASNVFHLAGVRPLHVDPTPLGFGLAALVLGWTLFRHRLFDLIPLARGAVLEAMADAVLVVDEGGQVIDLNPAAARLVGGTADHVLGRPVADLLPFAPAPTAATAPVVVSVHWPADRSYEMTVVPLNPGRRATGTLYVLRDVSDRRQAEAALLQLQTELERANEELQKLADTDVLTGLSSRRHFVQRLWEEVARARRYQHPLSLVMLDLDYFKGVNDRHGHGVGDRVLVNVAGVIQSLRRETDLVGRLGGEEFALILPNTDLDGGVQVAERLRQALAAFSHLDKEGRGFRVTASLGVVSLEEETKGAMSLLSQADSALYRAKEQGRDRVCAA